MKKLNVHLINPKTPAAAGLFVGSFPLPESFPMPAEDQPVQWDCGGFTVSVQEIEDN